MHVSVRLYTSKNIFTYKGRLLAPSVLVCFQIDNLLGLTCTESERNAIRVAGVVVVGSTASVDIAEVRRVAYIRRTLPPVGSRK